MFGAEYESDQPMGDEFKKEVMKAVIAPGTRKILGGLGNRGHGNNVH
jgi:hypothetical protein